MPTLLTLEPLLTSLLAYRNPRIIRRFQIDFPQFADQADSRFTELMKFLWLTQKQIADRWLFPSEEHLRFRVDIHNHMVHVDHMWHCFILCTKEYEEFCQEFFGKFMHHTPDAFDHLPLTKEEANKDLEKFLAYVYDNLGEETARAWFGQPVRATAEPALEAGRLTGVTF